jgi:Predicted ATPase
MAVKLLADELAYGNRHICTNLPLKLDELEKWLISKTGTSDRMRFLRMLTDSECMQFWNHYGVGYDVQGRIDIKEGDRKINVPDFGARFRDGKQFPGTCFFIDEFHIFFPSRAWAKTGDDALHYQSQHRGMGDDVVLISQHPEQCDKAMRRLCQDFTYLTNMGKTKVLGFSFSRAGDGVQLMRRKAISSR